MLMTPDVYKMRTGENLNVSSFGRSSRQTRPKTSEISMKLPSKADEDFEARAIRPLAERRSWNTQRPSLVIPSQLVEVSNFKCIRNGRREGN